MTTVKCNMYCKNVSRKGNCKLKVMEFNEFGNCANREFDTTKAECINCSYYDWDTQKCDIDDHDLKEHSKCTNGLYEQAD